MNSNKEQNIEIAINRFKELGIKYKSLNNGFHWKINAFNFFPSTHKWNHDFNKTFGEDIDSFIDKIKTVKFINKELSVEEMFEIARKVKPMNLESVCIALHKEIYDRR